MSYCLIFMLVGGCLFQVLGRWRSLHQEVTTLRPAHSGVATTRWVVTAVRVPISHTDQNHGGTVQLVIRGAEARHPSPNPSTNKHVRK